MESLSNRSDVRVLHAVGNDSSQTILNTLQLMKIKSCETLNKELQ